ncbi:MucR family transcriptional regulator [Camelimonas abortus]|uniref:MucR family transcriptional regulator n=1 Tax=Camelimonas abortus TaxID=1017184 RepID=A0ABV7LHS1_9HYPH
MTTSIVSAYVQNNQIDSDQLADVINSVHNSLSRLSGQAAEPANKLKPAVPIKKSVTPEYIVCLEDGKRFKFLKRHLSAAYGMTPAEYRAKWNLPPTYPMIAPNYASPRTRGPYGYNDIYIPEDEKEHNRLVNRQAGGASRKRMAHTG